MTLAGEPMWTFANLTLTPNVPDEAKAVLPCYMATVSRDGTFLINDVPAGSYLLSVIFMNNQMGSLQNKTVEVAPDANGQSADLVDLGEIRLVK